MAVRIIGGSRERPGEMLVGLNDRDKRWHDVYLLNLADGARELVLRNDRFISFRADRNLALRLAVGPTADGGLDYMVPDDTGGWRLLARVEEEDALATGIQGFGPAGANIAYCIDSRGRDRAAAVAVDLATGAATELLASPDAEVVGMLIDPVERGLQAVRTMGLRAAPGTSWTPASKRISRGSRRSTAATFISSAAAPTIAIGSSRMPAMSSRASITSTTGNPATARPMFPARPALAGAPLRAMQALTIQSRDGLHLPTYLTLPDGHDANQPPPMVMLVHGGPWARDSWGFNPWHQWLADRGYAALSVSYRGSTGFGKAYTNAGDREWGGRMQDDLLDAVDWAIQGSIADPRRIGDHGRELRRLRGAGRARVHAGGVCLRHRHLRPLRPGGADRQHPALLAAADRTVEAAGRRYRQRGGAAPAAQSARRCTGHRRLPGRC